MLIDSEPVQKFFKTPSHRWMMVAALTGASAIGAVAGYVSHHRPQETGYTLINAPQNVQTSPYNTSMHAMDSSTGWKVRLAKPTEISSINNPLNQPLHLDTAGFIYLPSLQGISSSAIQAKLNYDPKQNQWFPDLVIFTQDNFHIEQRVETVGNPNPDILVFSQKSRDILVKFQIDLNQHPPKLTFTELQELP